MTNTSMTLKMPGAVFCNRPRVLSKRAILPLMCRRIVIITFLFLTTSCNRPEDAPAKNRSAAPASVIDVKDIKGHIQKLASDEMEGRAPGGKGEQLATTYMADYFKAIGLRTEMQP